MQVFVCLFLFCFWFNWTWNLTVKETEKAVATILEESSVQVQKTWDSSTSD